MNLSLKVLEDYHKNLVNIYNLTLNVLIQLEKHNLIEALEIQKKAQALIQQSGSLFHQINPQKMKLDDKAKALLDELSLFRYKIELLTQRCRFVIDDYKELLRNKLKQIQAARRMNESQRNEQIGHISHI